MTVAFDRKSTRPERAEVVRVLRAHEREFRARGVRHLALFGSVARDEATAASDVDVAVEIAEDDKFSLIDQASLRVRLIELLGREADVVVTQDLRPPFKAAVRSQSFPVF